MLEFAVPEIGQVISLRKSFKLDAKSVGKQFLRNSWLAVVNRRTSFQQNLINKPVGREETFLQTILVDRVKQQFSAPTFCGSVWKSWRQRHLQVPIVDDVLSSHEQEIYPTTSLDGNCIEFEFQKDWNYYVDLRQSFFGIEAQLCQRTWLRYIRE